MADEPLHDTKTCTKCGQAKPATEQFFHRKGRAFKARCKPCRAEERSARYAADPEREKERNAAWADANPELDKARQRRWRETNLKREAESHRKWYLANAERVAENGRRWRAANPDKAARLIREYHLRRKRDPQYRLQRSVSASVCKSLKGAKGFRHTFDLLGYSAGELRAHLERQFLPGMNWDNYGDWHLDHIQPVASFHFQATDDPDFRACWALTNLRPLWALDNLKKSDKRVLLI